MLDQQRETDIIGHIFMQLRGFNQGEIKRYDDRGIEIYFIGTYGPVTIEIELDSEEKAVLKRPRIHPAGRNPGWAGGYSKKNDSFSEKKYGFARAILEGLSVDISEPSYVLSIIGN